MKNNTNRREVIITIVFVSIFVFSIMIIYGKILNSWNLQGVDLSKGWLMSQGSSEVPNYTLDRETKIPIGSTCTLTRQIPKDLQGYEYLFFATQNLDMRIYIEDKKIYEYGYHFGKVNRAPGDFVHFVRLPDDCEGKVLRIEFYFPYKNASYMPNFMQVVNGKETVISYLHQKMIPVLICLFVCALSIISIICEMLLFRRIFDNSCIFYISAFLFFLSAWAFTQTGIVPVLFGKKAYRASDAYIFLSLLPLMLVIYVIKRFKIKKKMFSQISVGILTVTFLITHIANFCGVWNYVNSLYLTHASLLYASFFLIYTTKKYSQNVENKSARTFLPISIAFLVICGFMDLANSYLRILTDYAFFSRFGILVLAMSVFMDVINSSVHVVLLGKDSDINRRKARTDFLTGLENRLALSDRINEIKEMAPDKQDYAVIAFDVNNLKIFNDTMGHEAGDLLLVESARIIERSCVAQGFSYRSGGDEFIVLLMGDAKKKAEIVQKNFEQLTIERNKHLNWDIPISIAMGMSIHEPGVQMGIDDIFREADRKMYQCKAAMKKKS